MDGDHNLAISDFKIHEGSSEPDGSLVCPHQAREAINHFRSAAT